MTERPEAAEAADDADEECGQHFDQDPADQDPEFDSYQSEALPAKTPESEFASEPSVSMLMYGQKEEEKEPRLRFARRDQYEQEDEQ
jgi:hypothetical protein